LVFLTGGRVLVVAHLDHGLVAVGELADHAGAQALLAVGDGVGDEVFGVQEQTAHRQRPAMPGLDRCLQLAEVMDVAQAVLTAGVVAIRRPAVVDRDTLEVGQHVGVIDRFAPAPLVGGVAGERLGAGTVNPPQPAGDPGAGLIEMRDGRVGEQRAQTLVKVAQPGSRGGDPLAQRPGRDRRPDQISQRLARPVIRQVLKDVQVHPERADPGPVLRRRRDPYGELAAADMPTVAATQRRDVLDHPQRPLLGNVEHLARLPALNALSPGKIIPTLIAALRWMLNACVRHSDPVKARAAVPLLTALLTPDRRRKLRLLGSTDGLESPSEDDGRELFRELAASCAFNTTISALSSTTSAVRSS